MKLSVSVRPPRPPTMQRVVFRALVAVAFGVLLVLDVHRGDRPVAVALDVACLVLWTVAAQVMYKRLKEPPKPPPGVSGDDVRK